MLFLFLHIITCGQRGSTGSNDVTRVRAQGQHPSCGGGGANSVQRAPQSHHTEQMFPHPHRCPCGRCKRYGARHKREVDESLVRCEIFDASVTFESRTVQLMSFPRKTEKNQPSTDVHCCPKESLFQTKKNSELKFAVLYYL